ncbi:MAG: methyltransferase domain-containing protein [Pseudomonadota bacterium]
MPGFDKAAATYDRSRHALIPDYDDLYGAAVEALQLDGVQGPQVLDLGAGTGGFSQEVVNAHPDCRVELSDLSVPMLEQARERFAADPRFSFRELDIVTGEFGSGWDRIISSFVIHHLPHEAKREVFANVCAALKPGGIFVNIDQVQACSQAVQDIHMRLWRKDALAAGALEQDLADGMARMEAMDINADLDDQVLWLQRAGFAQVDVVYRNYFWAVFVARKAA